MLGFIDSLKTFSVSFGRRFINSLVYRNLRSKFYKVYYWLKKRVPGYVLGIIIVAAVLFFLAPRAFALNTSTYGDVLSSSSTVNNLLSLIPERVTGKYDYIVFQNTSDSYYCFYGNDFTISGSTVTASNCDYIRYYRQGSTYSYVYSFGTDNLTLQVSNVVTSNLNLQKAANSFTFDEYQNNVILYFSVIIIAVFIIFSTLRGWFRGGSHN